MKNKKLIGSLIAIAFVLMTFSTIISSRSLNLNNSPKTSQESASDGLIPVDFPIYIRNSWNYIVGNNYWYNWSETVARYEWATGNGTKANPYIIEGIYVTNENQTAHISIETAEHFIIRNVTVSNYAKPAGHYTYAGIYVEKGEFGLIDNVTIINTSNGISLYEAKDAIKITNSKFIGSHNDSDTGLGSAILIHEAKGVNISYNDIYNFYNGIVVYDSEEIYIENNRIETTFGHVSDTGIYFYGVNDSTIVNNSLYGTIFSGHEYEEPKISSSGGLSIILENSYNIIIYGNKFYDFDGNLIVDDPDDLIDTMPNYWIFIFIGVAIIIAIIVVSVVLIKKEVIFRKK